MKGLSGFSGDDFEFAAGTIKGLRSWKIDDKGRLRGVTHPAVWLPGENVAVCKAETRCPKRAVDYGDGLTLYPGGPNLSGERYYRKPCDVEGCNGMTHKPTHTFDPECDCGFWAYDEVGYEEHGDVTGVIEGYGRTTIGTRGFRSEKARIVALCRNNDDGEGPLSLSEWLRLQQLYPDASFHTSLDEMVTAHGQVMRTWPEVGENFWVEDETTTPRSLSSQLASLNRQMRALSAAYTTPPLTPSWRRLLGGGS